MFLINFSLSVVITAILYLIRIIQFLILARAIVSWFPMEGGNPIYVFLSQLTEPIVGPVRSMLGKWQSMGPASVDFSPIVAYLLLSLISALITRIF